ncbi:MAG: VWA domain-containing protein [Treponematales bacterium]
MDMKNNSFSYFESFGAIADEQTRRKLSQVLYERLQTGENKSSFPSASDTGNFTPAIETILTNQTMRELCAKDASLAAQITQETLNFINGTKRLMQKTESPFAAEAACLREFVQVTKETFETQWGPAVAFVRETYEKQVFDTDFYQTEFQRSLAPNEEETGKVSRQNRPQFESVKEHFAEKWGDLLYEKQLQWELDFIDNERKKFCDELYRRIEELKKLQELLSPFTGELGRLWDMSRGRWQKVNFDVLAQYAALLERDAALRELAEMLGRLHSAEREYEEETFTDVIAKPEWKAAHAGRSELVGIRESDDINSMLPAEAALLADESTELLFYKKFTEKKLQTFEYQALSTREEKFQNTRQKAKEDKKGPVIICVDTSGSMHGTPETVAKTLCFALLKIAIRDNRKCYLISFSTGIETLNLTDIKNSLDKLIAFLSMSFHGGTDAAPALMEALHTLETEDYKKADVVMASDFVMPGLDDGTAARIEKARGNKTRFHSLVIGDSGNRNAIAGFDHNWLYDIRNDKGSILQLVRDIGTF